ncbi:hypothetical protein P5F80_12975, partial [Shouchella clausii]|nr:hypothetical protein [Shouchella clausii]
PQTDRKRLSDEECRRGKMRIERGFMSSDFLAHETTVSKHMTEANDEVCERLSTVWKLPIVAAFFIHKKAVGMSDGRWGIRVS